MERNHQSENFKRKQQPGMKENSSRDRGTEFENSFEKRSSWQGGKANDEGSRRKANKGRPNRSSSKEKRVKNGINIIRSFKGRDNRKKRGDQISDAYQGRLYSNASVGNRSDNYLEKGVYKVVCKQRHRESVQNVFTSVAQDDPETDAYGSDYALEFNRREQCSPEFLEYYMNLGDPYMMNNGEIAESNQGWYYDRCGGFSGRMYHQYGVSHQHAAPYEGMQQRYYPFYPQETKRPVDPYLLCTPRLYMNNYTMNTFNGYTNLQGVDASHDDYSCPIYQPAPYQDSAQRLPNYEEEDANTTVPYYASNNHYVQENDMLNIINLNSSFFVYNSNVHINTVRNEIYENNSNITDPNNCFRMTTGQISKECRKEFQ